ncbi:TetR/AcrR family transcriptional regulator [Catenuloplanes atrovinosus]|uniref:AcrR family transcriptional regulator n=1 Tax=Catenuloplanes atrovinosus TaxID=137266 RepID=A0AAE3YMK3_9ACTN|nr:helix-turn-helix domain-containing protein [Catenuloplanes atrovinosus]MDR7275086.1 AcrR family transcriptional regulator [Catenuloplanes atrovinosus]
MPRQTKEEIDEEIVEHAAALFAQHGFKDTSVQRIADAAGYSKTGLLHRFPNKEALWGAATGTCAAAMREVAETAAALPDGPARDRAVIEQLVDLALSSPGLASLALSFVGRATEPGEQDQLEGIARPVMTAFGVQPGTTDVGRVVRVIAAAGALAVATVALSRDQHPFDQLRSGSIRDHLIDAIYDALGHPR